MIDLRFVSQFIKFITVLKSYISMKIRKTSLSDVFWILSDM